MSGMNVSGLIMVQEAQRGGFEAHVYPTRLAAAIQLLRVEIRRSKSPGCTMAQIELQVAELIRGEMEDDEDEQGEES